jgi:hypothetical protein
VQDFCAYAGFNPNFVCTNIRDTYNCSGAPSAAPLLSRVTLSSVRSWDCRFFLGFCFALRADAWFRAAIIGNCQPLVNETVQFTMSQTGNT